jgi:hypothetical protein
VHWVYDTIFYDVVLPDIAAKKKNTIDEMQQNEAE